MRKSLFAIGLLAAVSSVQAQNVLLHVDDTATTYVSKGTLVYSGGGVQMRGNGLVENHGNFMVSGTTTDSFKTITTGGTDKPEGSATSNFINKLNEPDNYLLANANDGGVTAPVYTYGQLYITGVPQGNITGIVDEEMRQAKHGDYQQMGIPFFQKSVASLGTDVGKTFTPVRGSKNDVLYWHNTDVKAVHFGDLNLYKFGDAAPSTAYYMIGGQGLDLATAPKSIKGRPVSDDGTFANTPVTLSNAGANVTFGSFGQGHNSYNEAYNTYVADEFNGASGKWQGNYGKNMYQFANPYLTNLDLTNIGIAEAGGDGVTLNNIYGVRTEATGVQYTGTGSTAAAYKVVTFNSGVPTGDASSLVVRPFGAFTIKLNDNANIGNTALNFGNLRRFNYHGRASATPYTVTAAKNGATGTVKQLGVIALDANGKELDRTYYVVYPNGTTGHTSAQKTQYTASTANLLGTFEEATTGGIDPNYSSNYWLYINEANENDFTGKNVSLMNYSSQIKSYKFEIRENAELVSNGTHQLSTGTGFFYKAPNGSVMQAKQGETIPVTTNTLPYDLFYGEPKNVLATQNPVKSSRTMVVYNPEITNYIVRFDPNWKKADIEVYDMSGKLVISKKAVNTSTDFVIELDNSIKNSYVVKIVSDKGETVNTKILK
ncbi:T9SS type A sorting domain-containing protein [Chryseobacterium sp. G0201]|uniref:T9SS type A sorting domain-containing protein n=1 Tax=Chryseobacterium sp. G0201 TaxID=2487065 RepID=UPI000F4E251F|nr:T9SS type A sorting domain-containing protein [Chryseobacterium sp. G0201]AZA53279.1 T9SS C-terminal target domain-containing protein [Chryseobacterium sp. G0201]